MFPPTSSDDWLPLARNLDWRSGEIDERELFPPEMSGEPWLPSEAWSDWDEPYKTWFGDYVRGQTEKEVAVAAISDALGRTRDVSRLDRAWLSGVKLHAATLPLAEFAAVVGNLRAARFGRHGAWRTTAVFGALDELRHTQIPLQLMHPMVRFDAQFDWTHRFYHTNNWVSIAARHLFDELLLCANAIEFAIATNFVFETGFTNLQFIGLAAVSDQVDDRLFQTMLTSIQTDEARHAQIGPPVLEVVVANDPEYAQYMVDKWFWRSWLVFAILTGFTMDYLTPVTRRVQSFKEFVNEWVVTQFLRSVDAMGLQPPWYWDIFERSLDNYHHMVYASAYSYRATVWFDMVLPGPDERRWLRRKYPDTFAAYEPIWERLTDAWRRADPGIDFQVHGMAVPLFCNLCQLVLSHGTPDDNDAMVHNHDGRKYVFCSEPCRWIFTQEPDRYAAHKDIVQRVLTGEAPGNITEFLRRYSKLSYSEWGKDAFGGVYPWMSDGSRW